MIECMTIEEYRALQSKTGKSKYNAKKTKVDGITFPSKLEADYYIQLKRRKEAGDILYFILQVPFQIPGNIKYLVDFMIVHLDGSLEYVDTKGYMTQVAKNKIKQVEALYPIEINIVKKV